MGVPIYIIKSFLLLFFKKDAFFLFYNPLILLAIVLARRLENEG